MTLVYSMDETPTNANTVINADQMAPVEAPEMVLAAGLAVVVPVLGAGVLGAGVLGAGVLGAGVLGAGVLGAGVLGAGVLGAGVLGAGVLGAGVLGAGVLGAGVEVELTVYAAVTTAESDLPVPAHPIAFNVLVAETVGLAVAL